MYAVNDYDMIILFLVVRAFRNGEYVVSGTLESDRNDLYFCPTEPVTRLREAFGVLIDRMHMDGCKVLRWGFLKAESPASIFLQELGAEKGASRPNVRIKFNDCDYESYFVRLDKHARQNVRTAYNRLRTDGKDFALEVYTTEGIGGSVKSSAYREARNAALRIYMERQRSHYGVKHGWRSKVAQFLNWHIEASRYYFLALLKYNGSAVAFVNGLVIPHKHEFWGVRLAIDLTFARYSPGLMLVNELNKFMIERTHYKCFNLGQGNEKYKYDMGGQEDLTRDWVLRLDSIESKTLR